MIHIQTTGDDAFDTDKRLLEILTGYHVELHYKSGGSTRVEIMAVMDNGELVYLSRPIDNDGNSTGPEGIYLTRQYRKDRSSVNLTPTDEQQAVLDSYKDGSGVVEAYAGTGKTATLKLLAQDSPDSKFFYVAYNRAIADDAKASFPSNATCRTMHSVAFGAVGVKFKHRLNAPRMRAREVADILGIDATFHIDSKRQIKPWQLVSLVNQTVQRFCYSDSEGLTHEHVPRVRGAEDVQWELSELVARYASLAWGDLTKTDGNLRYTHDCYLKQYALLHPTIRTDYLLLDEAQDANPVITQIVMEQDCQKILVGDRFQQLYGWRGARDAMQNFQADFRLLLSQSFRFGEYVAAEGNKWLTLLGAEVPLKGYSEIVDSVGELDEPRTILCRTNASVIAQAIFAQEHDRKVALVGGGTEMLAFAKAALDLQNGRETVHPDLMAFDDWSQVVEYVREEGADMKVIVDIIDRYGVRAILDVVEQSCSEEQADVIISTAHKAKGREWSSVKISDDFKEPVDEDTGEKKINRSEFMLLYVACTRAKEQLDNTNVAWVDEWLESDPDDIQLDDEEM